MNDQQIIKNQIYVDVRNLVEDLNFNYIDISYNLL